MECIRLAAGMRSIHKDARSARAWSREEAKDEAKQNQPGRISIVFNIIQIMAVLHVAARLECLELAKSECPTSHCAYRLVQRYRADGAAGLISRQRGQPGHRQLSDGISDVALPARLNYFDVPEVPPPVVLPVPAPVLPVVPVVPLVPVLPVAPSVPPRLHPPSINMSATAESATRTPVEDVFMIHPFQRVEDPQARKTTTPHAAPLLDIDDAERALFRRIRNSIGWR
jgi:hypothetical protein